MAESVDTKDRARQWYIDNPIATLRDVATQFDIPFETVRDWSKNEGWQSLRILRGGVEDGQILLQAGGMRNVLYEEITSGSVEPKELPNMVKAWLALLQVREPPPKDETIDRDELLNTLS